MSAWSRTIPTILACLLCACGKTPEPSAHEGDASLRVPEAGADLNEADLADCAQIDPHVTALWLERETRGIARHHSRDNSRTGTKTAVSADH